MTFEPIEGESIDSEHVERFVTFVYAAMLTADTSDYVVDSFGFVTVPTTIEKDRRRVERMEVEARKGAR